MLLPRTAHQATACLCAAIATLMLGGCSPNETPQPASTGALPGSAPATTARESATNVAEPERAVVAEALPYGEVDEKLVYGYFVFPEDMIDPLPAIILIHDWWGLDANMRATAERLAGEGYIVLGVDLFGGNTAASASDARVLEIEVVENPNLALENLRLAHDFIANTAGAPSVAVVGFGFGGGWSLRATTELDADIAACVTFYGQVPGDKSVIAQLNSPFLGLFADDDRAVPKSEVQVFAEGLDEFEKDAEIVFFEDARRGFVDPQSDYYRPADAADAWNQVTGFLATKMASEE